MTHLRRKYYGVSKGSKRFPYREIRNEKTLSPEQAQSDYDFLLAKRTKLVRQIARDIQEHGIQKEEDLTEELLASHTVVRNIDKRLGELIEMYPEVER